MGKHYIQIIPIKTKLKELSDWKKKLKIDSVFNGKQFIALNKVANQVHLPNKAWTESLYNIDLVCCKILDCILVGHHPLKRLQNTLLQTDLQNLCDIK
jgi:hypothetical protein